VLAGRSPKEIEEYILPSTLPQTLKSQVLFEFLKFCGVSKFPDLLTGNYISMNGCEKIFMLQIIT
jgi:hypothetical protein